MDLLRWDLRSGLKRTESYSGALKEKELNAERDAKSHRFSAKNWSYWVDFWVDSRFRCRSGEVSQYAVRRCLTLPPLDNWGVGNKVSQLIMKRIWPIIYWITYLGILDWSICCFLLSFPFRSLHIISFHYFFATNLEMKGDKLNREWMGS